MTKATYKRVRLMTLESQSKGMVQVTGAAAEMLTCDPQAGVRELIQNATVTSCLKP